MKSSVVTLTLLHIFCCLRLSLPIHGFLLKFQLQGSHPHPPCCTLDRALGISPSSSSPLPPQDDEKEIQDPHSRHDLKSLNWNIPNLFGARSEIPGSASPHKHLNDIYRAGLKAKTQQLQSFHPTPTYSGTENGPSWNYKANTKASASASTLANISLPNPELEKVRRFLAIHPNDNDLGHDGRFATGTNFISLQANLVFSMDRPLTYMQEVISPYSDMRFTSTSPDMCPQFRTTPRNSISDQGEEAVVFCPGLHTSLLQSTRQRKYLSQVMNGMDISLLHVGTHVCPPPIIPEDVEKIQVYLTADTVVALRALDIVLDCDNEFQAKCECKASNDGGWYGLTLHELDLLRAWQWQPGSDTNPNEEDQLVDTLVKLLDVAVENEYKFVAHSRTVTSAPTAYRKEPHLVLLAYSATARAIATAVARWKQQATSTSPINHKNGMNSLRNIGLSPGKAHELLRKAVTIVTIAGLCHSDTYPDGPAYLHISMYDDSLAAPFQNEATGTGQDAVVLRAFSPYLYDTNSNYDRSCASISLADDAHNPEASAIQFLSLVMRKNGMHGQGFRQLYNEGSKPTSQADVGPSYWVNYYVNKVGELDIPPSEELLAAMIQATGGDRWLLTPLHLRDEDDEILPDSNNAESTITENFGYGVYEEIVDACGLMK